MRQWCESWPRCSSAVVEQAERDVGVADVDHEQRGHALLLRNRHVTRDDAHAASRLRSRSSRAPSAATPSATPLRRAPSSSHHRERAAAHRGSAPRSAAAGPRSRAPRRCRACARAHCTAAARRRCGRSCARSGSRGWSPCRRNSSGKLAPVDVQVDADAEHQEDDAGGLGGELHQDARGLEAAEQHVVGPLDLDRAAVAHGLLDRLGDGHRAGEDPGRRLGGGEARAQHDRAVEVLARRREERAAEPAAAGGLRLGHDRRAVRRARARELERHAVRRVGGLEPAQVARQPARLEPGVDLFRVAGDRVCRRAGSRRPVSPRSRSRARAATRRASRSVRARRPARRRARRPSRSGRRRDAGQPGRAPGRASRPGAPGPDSSAIDLEGHVGGRRRVGDASRSRCARPRSRRSRARSRA